jgi:hypothetical protein
MSSSHLYPSTIMAGFLMVTASVSHAEVSVQGTPEVLRIEAKNASIEEVLGALRDAYSLTYQSYIPLGGQVSGTYVGPLPQVLARLLEGSNFVLTHSGNTFRVVITSLAGPQPVPAAPSGMSFPTTETKASPTPQAPVGIVFPPAPPPAPSARKNY